ncbi:MAG: recombinase family protein [Marmoricola sp.]
MAGLAAIYTRISSDPEGRELGVRRQEEDCRALAERHDLSVAEVFAENDVSASTMSKKPRPRYDALMRAAEAGEFDTILAYSNSRLTRRPSDLDALIKLHERTGGRVRYRTVVSGDDDLSTADGRMVARIKASVDAAYSEGISERSRRAKAQAAAEGRWLGGRRPFGYEADGLTVRPDEAALVRQATRDLLAGRSLAALTREWNEAGFVGTSGTPFTPTRVRRVLQRARNAGLVEVRVDGPSGRGEVLGPATWPSIVPEDEWRALQAFLDDPARRTTTGPQPRWLGSGIYRCECGAKMVVKMSKGVRYYACKSSGHVVRRQDFVDQAVAAVVREYLRDPRIADRLQPDTTGAAKVDRGRADELRRKLAVAEADYFAGNINGRQLRGVTDSVEAELDAIAAREAARLSTATLGDVLSARDPGAAFDAATLDRQRAVIDTLIAVTIRKGRKGRPAGWTPGSPYVDLDSVEIRSK